MGFDYEEGVEQLGFGKWIGEIGLGLNAVVLLVSKPHKLLIRL